MVMYRLRYIGTVYMLASLLVLMHRKSAKWSTLTFKLKHSHDVFHTPKINLVTSDPCDLKSCGNRLFFH